MQSKELNKIYKQSKSTPIGTAKQKKVAAKRTKFKFKGCGCGAR
ncbi:hypothetical protein [Bacillus seohaeanensis]|jgi:hypothetical protein|uniref:Uncharacterized protein n=1 Tax=Bacillus seohaeanensis TaxID=284580 RepID=A0ABW5RXR7_9BACI